MVTSMSFSSAPVTSEPVENHVLSELYSHLGDSVTRTVGGHQTLVDCQSKSPSDPFSDYWKAWLTGSRPAAPESGRTITVADLFSGCGGLSVGIREACNA